MRLNNGIIVDTYLDDSGVFKENRFVQHIPYHNQNIHYCSVNAHHQKYVD